MRARPQGQRFLVVRAQQQQPAPRDEVDESLEGQPDRSKVRVDIRVVVLDVVDDGDVGQVLEKLGGLVEEGAVVFVALDHELPSAADPVAALEVLGDAADEDARVRAAVRQQPPRQRRRRGLAVRPRNDDRPGAPEKVVADGLGQRTVSNLPIEHFLELGVAARDGVADDHEVDVGVDVFRRCSPARWRFPAAAGSRSSADRRSGPTRERRSLCSSAAPRASPSQCRTRQSDEYAPSNAAASTADSSITSKGRSPATTRRSDAERQRERRPGRVARRKAEEHRTREIRQRLDGPPSARRRCRPARRISEARRRRPRTRAASRPLSSQLRQHAIEPVRALRHFVQEEHASRGADRRRRACRATPTSCVSVPPTSIPRASPGRSVSSLRVRDLPHRLRPAHAAQERSRDRSPPRLAPVGPRASGHGMVTMPHVVRQPGQNRGVVAVADERLRLAAVEVQLARAPAGAGRCRSRHARR